MREKCSLTPNLKRMRAIHPGIFGGDDGSGEYSKCVALPMVTWARVGLDMRNRDFLRNSAAANGAAARQPAWGFSTVLFFDALMMVEMVIISLSYQNSFRKASLLFLSANYKSVPVSGQGLSLADLRYLEEKAKQLHEEGRASSKGDMSDWDGVYR